MYAIMTSKSNEPLLMYKQEKIRESFNKTENIMSVAIRSRIKEYIVPLKYS